MPWHFWAARWGCLLHSHCASILLPWRELGPGNAGERCQSLGLRQEARATLNFPGFATLLGRGEVGVIHQPDCWWPGGESRGDSRLAPPSGPGSRNCAGEFMAASRAASSLRGAQLVPSLSRLLLPRASTPAEAFASAGSTGNPQAALSEALPAWSSQSSHYSGGTVASADIQERRSVSGLVHGAAPSSEGAYSSRSSRSVHSLGAPELMHATTVLCVRRDNTVVIIGDGQVTLGSQIMKPNVRKVRRLGEGKKVIAGFAGAAADGFTLFERLETRIDEFPGQLTRAAVELAKAWRTDKFLRRLDAVMVVADSKVSLMLSGNGDVLEPHDGIIGIGSGGAYALSAARALIDIPDYDAERIARKAMQIAADTCIYTNSNFTMEKIDSSSE